MKHLAKNTRPVTNTENTPRVKPHFEEPTLKGGFRPCVNLQQLVKEGDSMRERIFSYYRKGDDAPEIIIHFEPYAYVCHDEGVLYRPYIKTHKEEQEELSQYLREMYGKIKHQHPP